MTGRMVALGDRALGGLFDELAGLQSGSVWRGNV